MENVSTLCRVCDRVIPDDEKIYVYRYLLERVVGPLNFARLGESHFSVCHACRTKHKIMGQMRAADADLIAQVRKFKESHDASTGNLLGCCVCGKWLPEGFNGLIISHSHKRLFNGAVRMDKSIYNVASCNDCDSVNSLMQRIDLMLNILIDKWRRERSTTRCK